MANEEYKAYLAKHKADFIVLTDLQEKELARLYINAASEIKLRAADIIDKQGLTYAQAKIRIKSLLIEASRLSDGFKTILDKSLIDSADLGAEVNKIIMGKYQDALKKEGINLNLGKILSKVNPESVKAVYNRIWTDGLKLSDRVWLLDRRTKQEIERIVLQNIVSGGSASNKVTLSALDNLLQPGSLKWDSKTQRFISIPEYKPAKLTSLHGRKVGYESSRLLRTSMSEAFNEGDRLSNLKNPGSTGLKLLNAVGACEICTPLDGLPVEQTGLPPIHVNCRCTTLDEVMSVEAFTDRWIKFMDNPNSDKKLGDWLVNIYQKSA